VERYLLVIVGGAAGSLLRFLISSAIAMRWPGRFPLGTFAVNVTGSFLAGVIMTVLAERGAHHNWRLLLVVGFLGGYTTFSAFEYETYLAARGADYIMAALYVAGSVVAGFAALWIGAQLVRR
jgi:fluoride exporter